MISARAGALAGFAAAAVLTAGWLLGGALQGGGYDWADQEISDLGALTARYAWTWNLADSLSGALICVLALGLSGALERSRAVVAGIVLLAIVGVGGVLDGLVREDCPLSTSAACQRLQDGPGLSWHHQAHDVESVIVALAMSSAPLVLATPLAVLGSRRLRSWSLALGAAVSVAFLVYLPLYGSGGGIAQRLAILAFTAWLVLASAALWQRRRGVAGTT